MTKEKGILSSIEHTLEQGDVTQNGFEPKRRAVKKNARIVDISNDIKPSYEHEQQQLELLFSSLTQTLESTRLPSLPPIPVHIKNDDLLNRLMPQYNNLRQQYEQVVSEMCSRWSTCHTQPGYKDYLTQLINNAIATLPPLHHEIQTLQEQITKRVQLISIQPVTKQALYAAQREFICALDVFILSLSVLRLDPQEYPEATEYKHQIKACLQDLHHRINHQDLRANTSTTNKLMKILLQHLGLSQSIFGSYFNTPAKPINYDEINKLYHLVFKTEGQGNNKTKQFLALYDLSSRLKHYPIYLIKKHELLYTWYYSIQKQRIETREHILKTLKQLHQQLSQKNALFVGVDSPSYLQESVHLLIEIDELVQHIQTHFKQSHSDQGSSKSVIELQQLTQLQAETRLRLATVVQQTCDLEMKSRLCLLRLNDLYSRELRFLINNFKNIIQNAKHIAMIHANEPLQDLENAEHLLEELNRDQTMPPLGMVKLKINQHYNSLNQFINEFKSQLKKEWANLILCLLLEQNRSMPCTVSTPMHNILMHMRIQNEPYRSPQLHPHNPFISVLNDNTRDCNESLNQLIQHFARLESLTGEPLESWIKDIKRHYQLSHQNITKHKTLSHQAQTIEMRLQSSSYRISLKLINIIINELQLMLKKLYELQSIPTKDHALLKNILENPNNLMLYQELPSELTKQLQQKAPQFPKLLSLIKEFQSVNTEHISLDLALCAENDYIPMLLSITRKHLTDDCREFYSRGLASTNNYIEWLHLCVYKPLLQFYVPKLAVEVRNESEQGARQIGFFSDIPNKLEISSKTYCR